MPLYTYRCLQCDEVFDEPRRIAERDDATKCQHCDGIATRDTGAEIRTCAKGRSASVVWLSDAMGCLPEEVPEFKKVFPGSEYTPDGRLVMRGLKHRDAEIKRRGLVDYR